MCHFHGPDNNRNAANAKRRPLWDFLPGHSKQVVWSQRSICTEPARMSARAQRALDCAPR